MPYPHPYDEDWRVYDDELLAAYGYGPFGAHPAGGIGPNISGQYGPYSSGSFAPYHAPVGTSYGPVAYGDIGYGGGYPGFPGPGGTGTAPYGSVYSPYSTVPHGGNESFPYGMSYGGPPAGYGGYGGNDFSSLAFILLLILGGGYYLYSRGFLT